MFTNDHKTKLENIFPSLWKDCTQNIQKRILTNPLEPDECKVYFSKKEMIIQYYKSLWLHTCIVPSTIWLTSWKATSPYIDDPAHWTKSLYQCNIDRLHNTMAAWRKMPAGPDKDQFLDRLVRDNCIDYGLGIRFACNTGEPIPDDMQAEMKRLGFSA